MIVPALKGGLCNQIFQICAALGMARDNGTDFAINYNLPHGCIAGFKPIKYKDDLYKNIPTTNYVPNKQWSEPKFSYTPPPSDKDLLIDGYFQTIKYFEKYIDEVKNLFHFSDDVVSRCNIILNRTNKYKVGVHIRRGDYLRFKNIHFICDDDYYVRASKYFNECSFVVCSDDYNIIRNINMGDTVYSESFDEVVDLYILSQCDSMIMSNSSFSWWGTVFGKIKDKVVTPKTWFGPEGYQDYQDIYIENWIKI
jgi:hypothetical protein